MRHFGMFFFLMLIALSLWGQNSVQILSESDNEITLKFTLTDYSLKEVSTPQGTQFIVEAPGLTSILEKGAPDLPKFTASLIIPGDKKMNYKVVSYEVKEIKNVAIAPSKGNFTRDIDPASVPYTYGKYYNRNEFYPLKLASAGSPYILRNYRGMALYAYPFQYNPKTQTLKVYSEIIVKVFADGKGKINVLPAKAHPQKISYEFHQIYKHHFLNYGYYAPKYTPLEEEGNMLIICYDDFVDAMQDFVVWKNTIGRPCEIVPFSEVGSTANDIKNYVSNYYNNNGLTYLLLVGDAQQIPTNEDDPNLGGPSDNAYGYLAGDDHYQEIFVGRFSATNTDQVATMVQRTINYEKGDQLAANWLNRTLAIASDQGEGQGDDGEADYQHARNMQTDLLNYTYVEPPYELFDGSQGGQDAPGNPTPTDVANVVNSGVGIITYTGHGDVDMWVSSGFSVSDVQNLTNANQLPFIWSVACVNGEFVNTSECFAESWLRHTDNQGNPIGAIAFFGSTINQSWAPPMEAQDEMVDILVESYQDNIKRTFAGLSINGCFKMNDTYQDYDMTDTWTVFGDPSVYVRTDNPSAMAITHDNEIVYGNNIFSVNCDYNGARATISKNGQIIGSALVENGMANIELNQDLFEPGDELTLAVFGYNKITYLTTINVNTSDGPYVVMNQYQIGDTNVLFYNRSQHLTLSFKNVGSENASNVTATITSDDEHITLSNNQNIQLGDINADQTITNSSVIVTVDNEVEDLHLALFTVTLTDAEGNSWQKDFYVKIYAPEFESNFKSVEDGDGGIAFASIPNTAVNPGQEYVYNIKTEILGGNGNNVLDPGETVILKFIAKNLGHANASDVLARLETDNQYVTIETPEQTIPYLLAGSEIELPFKITVSDDAPQYGEVVHFKLYLSSGSYTDTLFTDQTIGLVIEGFETGDFSFINWNNGGDLPWEITTNDPYEGTYCAGVPAALDNDQASTLSLQLNNVPAGLSMSFYYKVSSEEDYDFLRFKVNGTEVASWSGEVPWSEYNYTFQDGGNYTLEWTYEKDGSVSSGDDKAYLDLITLPLAPSKGVKNITITGVNLPSWLTLTDNGDGTASLSGTAPAEENTYHITLLATNGTDSVSQEFDLLVTPTNIANKNFIKVYPNPAVNQLVIEVPNHEKAHLTITDVAGKTLMQRDLNSSSNKIDLTNLKSGLYIINIYDGQTKYEYKIIKK